MRLLPENCWPEDQHRGFFQETVYQNLAVFCTALCVGLCDFTKQGILIWGFCKLDFVSGTSAKCKNFCYWYKLDTCSHFCVLYAVPVLLHSDWKQEESTGGVAVVALVFNWLCSSYFNAGRANIVYDAIYFIAGGLIFLYRRGLAEFASKYKVIAGVILLNAAVAYFTVGGETLTMLFFCVAALVYTLGCNGGYWSILLPSSSVVSASRFTYATW